LIGFKFLVDRDSCPTPIKYRKFLGTIFIAYMQVVSTIGRSRPLRMGRKSTQRSAEDPKNWHLKLGKAGVKLWLIWWHQKAN